MGPRPATRQTRENDYSNIGITGRKTGITLPVARLDANGMEEMSQLFSPSPRKPSPLRKSISVEQHGGANEETITPRSVGKKTPPSRSKRKSALPKSASPRKSGISGTARRSTAVDVLRQSKDKENQVEVEQPRDKTPVLRPTPAPTTTRRFSPEKTPLQDVTKSRQQTAQSSRVSRSAAHAASREDAQTASIASTDPPVAIVAAEGVSLANHAAAVPVQHYADYELPAMGDDDDAIDAMSHADDDHDAVPLPLPHDDEDADETFVPEARLISQSREPTIANSRRKRKSDVPDTDLEPDPISSPAAKRAKRISDQSMRRDKRKQQQQQQQSYLPTAETALPKSTQKETSKPRDKGKGRAVEAQTGQSNDLKLSKRQEKELNEYVDKIKARPGQNKSLYILRRETPMDDSVTHTRSGRISVKPLAYWRNERCVFGGSPGGASLAEGARFPLNSIKEIIRTDEIGGDTLGNKKKKKRGRKGKNDGNKRAGAASADDDNDPDAVTEQGRNPTYQDDDEQDDDSDQDAEPWETEIGTFRGNVSVWDHEQQSAIQEEEEVDIAYASGAIETREVKNSTFKYAKLLSKRFFGSGLVELPPGAVKRPKNSRKMHMSFFCAEGRVTVSVGPLGGPENRFSIGKGGFWQVPRGNQYGIENELDKTALIFFSQACEPAPSGFEE